jgi:hypothetical protein
MEKRMNGFLGGAFVFWMLGSWLTHVITCINNSEWFFLIAGALFFPIAIIHGTGVWFGAW